MSSETEKRRRYHYLHSNMRLRQRYGVEMTWEEYLDLSSQFRDGRVKNPRTDAIGNVEGWVSLRGALVCASYKPGLKVIGTVMPAAPERPVTPLSGQPPDGWGAKMEIVARKRAASLVQSAINSGTIPKWLANDPDFVPERRSDLAWFKERARRAASLIRSGDHEGALHIIEALVALPRSLRPSADPDAAERALSDLVEHRRCWRASSAVGE